MSTDHFIPDIDQHCDRWCERCRYVGRCRTYCQRSAAARLPEDAPADNLDAQVKDLGRMLAKAHRMLARFVSREGLDLDQLPPEPRDDAERRRIEDDPLVRQADAYMANCRRLLDRLRPAFNEAADDVRYRSTLMDVAPSVEKLMRIRDAFEVLCWDQTLIPVKVRRAVRVGRLLSPQQQQVDAYDRVGSAAVAMRSLRRSHAAMLELVGWSPGALGRLLSELLTQADELMTDLQRVLPGCATFQWPPPHAAGEH